MSFVLQVWATLIYPIQTHNDVLVSPACIFSKSHSQNEIQRSISPLLAFPLFTPVREWPVGPTFVPPTSRFQVQSSGGDLLHVRAESDREYSPGMVHLNKVGRCRDLFPRPVLFVIGYVLMCLELYPTQTFMFKHQRRNSTDRRLVKDGGLGSAERVCRSVFCIQVLNHCRAVRPLRPGMSARVSVNL